MREGLQAVKTQTMLINPLIIKKTLLWRKNRVFKSAYVMENIKIQTTHSNQNEEYKSKRIIIRMKV